MRAQKYHYINDALSEDTFTTLLEEARKIDEDLKNLNKTASLLDPEIQEQMRQFEMLEKLERAVKTGNVPQINIS